jgi:hypothetical protein
MHLLVISLLTILAGTLLLAKFRKETPGKIFICISWFFIVVGFLLFIGFVAGGICRISKDGFPPRADIRHEMMMKQGHPGMPGFCCPQPVGHRMCPGKQGCMMHDSTMKCCPGHMMRDSAGMKCCRRHMMADTAKMPVKKK